MKHLFLFVVLLIFACSENMKQDVEPLALSSQAPGVKLRFWRLSDSTFALVSSDTTGISSGGQGKETIVREDSLKMWLKLWLPSELALDQYFDNDTVYQTLSISSDTLSISGGNSISLEDYKPQQLLLSIVNDTLYIQGGNGVSLEDYLGGGTEITDTLNLSGTDPVIIFDDTSPGGRDFAIQSIPNAFEIYDITSGSSRVYVDAEGRVGFGAAAPSEAKMYLYGGASGANFDARSSQANSSATFEAQSHDFETSFQSTFIQQSGSGVAGNAIDAIPNAGLGRLVFQGSDNALIYTVFDDPLIFGTDFTERMRIKETGIINIKTTPPTYADDTAAGAGGLVAGDIYKTSAGVLMIKL